METMKTNKNLIELDKNKSESIGKLLIDKINTYLEKDNLNLENLTDEDIENEKVILPSILYKELNAFAKEFENLSEDEINELSDDTRMLLLKLGSIIGPVDSPSSQYLYNNDVSKKPLEKETVVNEVNYKDKDYGIIYPKINNVKNEASFLMELQEGVGLGKLTKIILWNSGIWITIRPPQNEDLINLYTKLTKEIELVAEDTTLYGFSNISSVFYKVAWEYVLDHLVDSSLKVNRKYLANYISILDSDTILLGILSQLFYTGFNTTLLCKNNYKVENGKPKCGFSYDVNLDLTKLLWVDTSKLDVELMTTISKRGANSQTVEEIKAYQSKLQTTDNETVINLNNGKTIKLKLNIASLTESFNSSELFLTELRKSINAGLANATEEDKKNMDELKSKFLNMANRSLFLGIYSHYVNEVSMGDYKTDDKNIILKTLKTLSSNIDDTNNIINKINNFITNSSLTTIAIPDFVCPVCGASQDDKAAFEHLVPLNMVNYFFTLLKLRFMKQLLEKAKTE